MQERLAVVLHKSAHILNKNRMSSPSRKRQRFLARTDAAALVALFEQLSDVSFFLKDERGRFMALNRRGCDFCGVASEADAIGRTDADFFPRQRAADYRRDDLAVMASGTAMMERVESAPEEEASPRLVLTAKVPVRDRSGRVIGIAGISRVLTELRTERQRLAMLDRVIVHLHDHFTEALPSSTLAAIAGLSVSQFERSFRRAFGTTPHQYVLRLRIDAACRQLAQSDDSIAAIAVGCGFADHAHLTRSFSRHMSMTPTQYRHRYPPK
jgi:PAS domain S-box-containing protein